MTTRKYNPCHVQTFVPVTIHELFCKAAYQRGLSKAAMVRSLMIEFLESNGYEIDHQ